MVKSANRACLILDLVGHPKGGLRHSEIIKALNIPTRSLLADLVDHEYLSMDPVNRRYSLGSKILLLAGEYLNGLDIVETTRPFVRSLSVATGESIAVAVRSGSDIVPRVEKIRSNGVAYNREELLEGIIAIGAPVLDLHGNAVSAIVVSFPTSRWSRKKEKQFEILVREASATVSKKLGFKDHVAESRN
jgi:DNA-binding IclR family transcriptional regulator